MRRSASAEGQGRLLCMGVGIGTHRLAVALAGKLDAALRAVVLSAAPERAGRQTGDKMAGSQGRCPWPAGSRRQAAVHWGPPAAAPGLPALPPPPRLPLLWAQTHAHRAVRSHLRAQPGLDAVLAEAVHAGGHRPRVLNDACRQAGQAGRREGRSRSRSRQGGTGWWGTTREAQMWVLAVRAGMWWQRWQRQWGMQGGLSIDRGLDGRVLGMEGTG